MSKEVWTLDEIQVSVSGFFTSHHQFQTEAGSLGKCTFPAFSQHCVYITPDERELLMQKTHWLSSAHEMVENNVVRGRADRPGLLRRDLDIQFDGKAYSLVPEGLLSRGWFLFDAGGSKLLELRYYGVFRDRAVLTIHGAVDADLVIFAYYLVHMRFQEEAAAGAAAAAGGAS